MFDDYNAVYGSTKVIDEFIINKCPYTEIRKNPYYKIPSYIIKDVEVNKNV